MSNVQCMTGILHIIAKQEYLYEDVYLEYAVIMDFRVYHVMYSNV